ncbi:hypothetical protein ACEPAG_3944 [Sanghuangporus baumii]
MFVYNNLWFIIPILFSATAIAVYRHYRHAKSRFPPGPAPLPIVGNLFQMPREDPEKHYNKWKEVYGPIMYFRIFKRQFVVLNDRRVMLDLLEKRCSIYSSRPEAPMAKLAGRDKTALFLPAGHRSKETRKLMLSFLGPRSEEVYLPVIETETYRFLHRLLRNPGNFFADIKSLPAASILRLVYGYQISNVNDYFVELSEKLGRITAESTQTGRWLVNAIPSIRHLPSWLPGMQFKKWAADARAKCEAFMRIPHEYVKSSMATGKFLPSFTSYNLQKQPGLSEEAEEILMYAAASLYAGATDTASCFISPSDNLLTRLQMVSVLKLFFLMMALHPEVQACVQREIDQQIGDDRPPCTSDLEFMPYITCIFKELLRFNPVGPIIIHSPERDDVYEGYTIPKGCWIMANAWSILKDPAIYPEPDSFIPERFDKRSGDVQPDPDSFIFGFGRRVCPGQHFAVKALCMAMASILWGFNITPERDLNGRPVLPEMAFSKGLVIHPLPFRCSITPRSPKAAAIIEELVKSGECEKAE